jgi:hypothetical protein
MFTPFQQPKLDASASNQDVAAQASRILANGVRNGNVPPPADAQKRVDDTNCEHKEAETKTRQAADAARKATATFVLCALAHEALQSSGVAWACQRRLSALPSSTRSVSAIAS